VQLPQKKNGRAEKMHNPYLLQRSNCVASGTELSVPEIRIVGTHLKVCSYDLATRISGTENSVQDSTAFLRCNTLFLWIFLARLPFFKFLPTSCSRANYPSYVGLQVPLWCTFACNLFPNALNVYTFDIEVVLYIIYKIIVIIIL
jgi:hypothetical protein